MDTDELAAWLRLALTPGVGSVSARKLLAAWGSPQAVFQQSQSALCQVVTRAQAQALCTEPPDWRAQSEATERWLDAAPAGAGRRLVTLGDRTYPAALLATADPPLMLFLLGRVDLLDTAERKAPAPTDQGRAGNGWPGRAVAVVGSRNPTPQGRQDAEQFARALCLAGCTIVSGLALGTDGAAHQGALQAAAESGAAPQLATIAVIGTGIDRVYPSQHRELAHRITECGLIVSEYPLGSAPLAANFPKRNRLIAGLSQGVLVVEAALRSGSLITARLAGEQGKDVCAIPGSIHSPLSHGCHALIRTGAKLVESARDVLEELHWPTATTAAVADYQEQSEATSAHPDGAAALLRALGSDPASLDALQARTGLDTATLQARLLELELAGEVGRLPGGLFQRVARA
jgi:DNA processing protein